MQKTAVIGMELDADPMQNPSPFRADKPPCAHTINVLQSCGNHMRITANYCAAPELKTTASLGAAQQFAPIRMRLP